MSSKMDIRKPSQLAIIAGLAKYSLISSLRNRASYFFSLIFPLAFIAVFGLIGNSSSSITIGISDTVDHANPIYTTLQTVAGQSNAPLKLATGNTTDLETQLKQGKIGGILVPAADSTPRTPRLTLETTSGDPANAAAAQSFMNGITSQLNLRAAGVVNPPIAVENKEVSGKVYRYIDFILPGQIGFSLLSIATFGIAFPLITLRKTLVLKRMFATAVTPISFVISQCLSRSFQAMIQAVVILGVGVWWFHFSLAHGWISLLEMMVLSFLGVLMFLGFGILIGNVAKDEQSLPIALNLFNLPQMLLAGVFFPTDGMPQWVQTIGNHLPLAYLNNAMRDVATNGKHLNEVLPAIFGMLVWGVIAYVLAARVFAKE